MEAYDRSSQDVCSELKTEPRSGLTSTHAEEILTQVGENRLKAKRKQTVVERFFSQFKDAMILILLAAAAISFYVALQGSDPTEFFEPALILLIVILNAIMGTVQESKAERSPGSTSKYVCSPMRECVVMDRNPSLTPANWCPGISF